MKIARCAFPISVLLLIALATVAPAQQNVWTSHGPTGAGWVNALALDPQNPSTVWAGSQGPNGGKLFRSSDAGLTWSPDIGPSSLLSVDALAIDPGDSSKLYAGGPPDSAGHAAVYRSSDGGAHWTSSDLPSGVSVQALVFEPGSSKRIWAVSSGGLYRSDDGAQTWTNPLAAAHGVYCLLFDRSRPGTLYSGSYFGYFAGDAWDPPGTVGGSVFVSQDGGTTWFKSRDLGSAVVALATDPFDNGALYAGAGSGVFRSEDGGMSWQQLVQDPQSPVQGFPDLGFLVADPVRPGRLYAAAIDGQGVYRSIDGARTWHRFFAGGGFMEVSSLVISPDGKTLHAGTDGGVFELDLAPVPFFPCVPGASRLCLLGDRYAVDLVAWDVQNVGVGAARPLNDRAGYFSLPFVTNDPDLPEVVVKMLAEGSFGEAGGAPLFYSSLTTLPYMLTVTDTLSGEEQFYAGGYPFFCGGVDSFGATESSTLRRATPAAAGATALPLLGGRFSVTLEARNPHSGQAVGGVAMFSGDRFGFFSLPDLTGDPQFPEVVVKMIDARAITGTFWFFYTGLTSVDYTLSTTDTVTGKRLVYANATPFCGAANTDFFSDSPWDY